MNLEDLVPCKILPEQIQINKDEYYKLKVIEAAWHRLPLISFENNCTINDAVNNLAKIIIHKAMEAAMSTEGRLDAT